MFVIYLNGPLGLSSGSSTEKPARVPESHHQQMHIIFLPLYEYDRIIYMLQSTSCGSTLKGTPQVFLCAAALHLSGVRGGLNTSPSPSQPSSLPQVLVSPSLPLFPLSVLAHSYHRSLPLHTRSTHFHAHPLLMVKVLGMMDAGFSHRRRYFNGAAGMPG